MKQNEGRHLAPEPSIFFPTVFLAFDIFKTDYDIDSNEMNVDIVQ